MLLPSQGIQGYIAQGRLKELEYVSVPHPGITGMYLGMLKPRAHPEDYVSDELYRLLLSSESMAQLLKAYKEYADNKRGIVYAFNYTHAQAIAEYYSRHGVTTKVFYGDMQPKSQALAEAFRAGSLKVLVDIHGMSTGYPRPEVEFVQMTFPTQLLSEYIDMVETCMRVTTDYSEKERVVGSDNKLVVIDHVRMKETFGLPTEERDWEALFLERRIETEVELSKKMYKG